MLNTGREKDGVRKKKEEIWWKTERGTSAGTASVPALLLSSCFLLDNLFSQNAWETVDELPAVDSFYSVCH